MIYLQVTRDRDAVVGFVECPVGDLRTAIGQTRASVSVLVGLPQPYPAPAIWFWDNLRRLPCKIVGHDLACSPI